MEDKMFYFIKPYSNSEGTIPENSELVYFKGAIQLNGYMVSPAYYGELFNIIKDEKLRKEYLREVPFKTNKI